MNKFIAIICVLAVVAILGVATYLSWPARPATRQTPSEAIDRARTLVWAALGDETPEDAQWMNESARHLGEGCWLIQGSVRAKQLVHEYLVGLNWEGEERMPRVWYVRTDGNIWAAHTPCGVDVGL